MNNNPLNAIMSLKYYLLLSLWNFQYYFSIVCCSYLLYLVFTLILRTIFMYYQYLFYVTKVFC